jgi:hypothetical protein
VTFENQSSLQESLRDDMELPLGENAFRSQESEGARDNNDLLQMVSRIGPY